MLKTYVANLWQDVAGVNIATLFRKVKTVLQDVDAIGKEPESASESTPGSPRDSLDIEIGTELTGGLEGLAQKVDDDLQGKSYGTTILSLTAMLTRFLALDQEIKDTKAMISSHFAEFRTLAYRLYAVFVHHGSVSFGHYYIYIFDFDKQIWRKYNDEYVTEVQNVDEIFKPGSTNNPPTPYFLVYVNDDMKSRLASPVCREVNETMTDRLPDLLPSITMEGVRPTTPTTDANLKPPSYEEAASLNGTSGTGNLEAADSETTTWPGPRPATDSEHHW
jgi:ubiquitin carboxyl-terminal hydrolase 25/28